MEVLDKQKVSLLRSIGQIEHEVKKYIEQYDATAAEERRAHSIEVANLREQVARVEKLEEENVRLRAAASRGRSLSKEKRDDSPNHESTISAGVHKQTTRRQKAEFAKAHAILLDRMREIHVQARGWRAMYFDKVQEIAILKARLEDAGLPPNLSSDKTDPQLGQNNNNTTESRSKIMEATLEPPSSSTELISDEDTVCTASKVPPDIKKFEKVIAASDESESDCVDIVSERCLKRKRPSKGKSIQGNANCGSVRIKAEPCSSNPFGSLEIHPFDVKESLDLDEPFHHVVTPKKPKRQREYSTEKENEDQYARGNVHSRNSNLFNIATDSHHDPEYANLQPLRMLSDNFDTTAADQPAQEPLNGKPKLSRTKTILQLLDPNKTVQSRRALRKPHGARGAKGYKHSAVNILGEADNGTSDVKHMKSAVDGGEASVQENTVNCQDESLVHLLEGASKKKASIQFTARAQTPQTRHSNISKSRAHSVLELKKSGGLSREEKCISNDALLKEKNRAGLARKLLQDHPAMPTTAKPPIKPELSIPTESVRLRARPMEQLKPSDFRINPNRNQGYGYAFSEVIRGRERRRFSGVVTNEIRKLADELALQQHEHPDNAAHDERVLLEYFDGNEEILQNLSETERRDYLREAKAKELADKCSRIRENNIRKSSPPGFWRVEFPTTQEVKDDRERACLMERQEVVARYQEAMKKGGKWIFADE